MPDHRYQKFILVHASKSRPSGQCSDDDYDVWDGKAKAVGRIFRAAAAPQEQPWFWTITERASQHSINRGYAPTREDAIAAFKRAWQGRPDK
jgi:hypothetical protein